MTEKDIKYDVALSYAKEDREYVEKVAEQLINLGIRCFYDIHERANLWGKDLFQHLFDVYSKQAKFTVIFISKRYAEKIWTNHELKSAQSRAIKENSEYILPVRFDSTELPGLSSNTAYLNLQELTPGELVKLITSKLNFPNDNLTHVGYSYLLLRRDHEESSRNTSTWDWFWRSDKWDYSIPISIFLDGKFVGKSANGGDLFIETIPGEHKIIARETGHLWRAEGDAGAQSYDVTIESREHTFTLQEGKNILYLHYATGHVEKNIRDGKTLIYFSS